MCQKEKGVKLRYNRFLIIIVITITLICYHYSHFMNFGFLILYEQFYTFVNEIYTSLQKTVIFLNNHTSKFWLPMKWSIKTIPQQKLHFFLVFPFMSFNVIFKMTPFFQFLGHSLKNVILHVPMYFSSEYFNIKQSFTQNFLKICFWSGLQFNKT